jgi:HD-GYP domain-containing protein (c-di-GMP phosphodiesterase class II)
LTDSLWPESRRDGLARAIRDAYHAMISNRPYRRARRSDAAVAELRARAGTQSDPTVVAAFCAVLAEQPEAAGRLAGAASA